MGRISALDGSERLQMRYFTMNFIEPRSDYAEYWLNGDNAINSPAVAVFFGRTKASEIRHRIELERDEALGEPANRKWLEGMGGGSNWKHLTRFFDACETNPDRTRFVVFLRNTVAILKPISNIRDLTQKELRSYRSYQKGNGWTDRSNPKVCQVEEVLHRPKKDVPFVLATANADQGLNRGTINEIDRKCHLNALRSILNQEIKVDPSPRGILGNLGPIELETLVFLVLHERGLHVSANRGSTIPYIDLVVENSGRKDNDLEDLKPFTCREKTTLQIKTETPEPSRDADFTIALGCERPDNRLLDAMWLMRLASGNDRCFQWLRNELRWLGWGDAWARIRQSYVS